MKKKLVITGAGGFVGRNLIEYFSAKPESFDVLPVSRAVVDLHDEAAVKSLFKANSADLIIHCATIGGTRKTAYDSSRSDVVASNLRMFMNLARCLTPRMGMITLGSGAEYDKRYSIPKVAEESFDSSVPADPYGFSKYAISKYIEKAENITCLRIFGLYGRYEDYTYKFISNAIVKNLLGLPIVINQNVVFDYLWIGDFCAMVEQVSRLSPEYRHYNITPSESIDLVSIASLINAVAKNKSEVRVLNSGLNTEYTASNARLLKELGGFAFTPYAAGIKSLYDYYSSNLDKLDLEAVKQDPYLKFCKKS